MSELVVHKNKQTGSSERLRNKFDFSEGILSVMTFRGGGAITTKDYIADQACSHSLVDQFNGVLSAGVPYKPKSLVECPG